MTTKSPSSKAVDAVIQGDVKSFLKSEGFKKSGRTFHRQKGEMLQVVNFQTTWLNTPDEAQFTINLNVVLPFYHENGPVSHSRRTPEAQLPYAHVDWAIFFPRGQIGGGRLHRPLIAPS